MGGSPRTKPRERNPFHFILSRSWVSLHMAFPVLKKHELYIQRDPSTHASPSSLWLGDLKEVTQPLCVLISSVITGMKQYLPHSHWMEITELYFSSYSLVIWYICSTNIEWTKPLSQRPNLTFIMFIIKIVSLAHSWLTVKKLKATKNKDQVRLIQT